jgi:hypothetical protein
MVARVIEGGPDIFSLVNIEEWGRDTHRLRCCFDFAADAHQGGVSRIGQVRDASKHRYQFFEKLKSLRKQVGGKTTQPRDIAVRTGKVAHQRERFRSCGHDDRYRFACLLGRQRRGRPPRYDQIAIQMD